MNMNETAPVACTLTAVEFRSRAGWLQRLSAEALLSHSLEGSTARLKYKAGATPDLERLVREESRCCGFLSFSLLAASDGIELTISAPPEAENDLRLLLGTYCRTGRKRHEEVSEAAGNAFALVAASIATAAELPFNQEAFDELRNSGKPSVIHVYATWCGTCKVQASIVMPMLAEPEFAPLTLLKADFDKEKGLIEALGVSDRSTFVAFKGMTEVGRSVADMNKESIASLLRRTLE